MQWVDQKTIRVDRELSELDKIVLRFISLLEKHVPYVLVSGYVAILLGRSRTTEDVDLFIERISFPTFQNLYTDLLANGFWSVTVDDQQELFSMLEDRLSIRFAEQDKVVPNFEIKFIKDPLDRYALLNTITVLVPGGELRIAPLDLQIAYKKFVLMSKKDLEDARHLQNTFEISDENINKCKQLLQHYGRL